MQTITRAKGGTDEQVVKVEEIQIPDLWHVAMLFKDAYRKWQKQVEVAKECGQYPYSDPDEPSDSSLNTVTVVMNGQQCKVVADMILECWYLCNDLLKSVKST